MGQNVRVIKTEQDYESALARLSALMDQDLSVGSSAEAELELLALVIESYERTKVPPVVPDPIEAILLRMDQQGLGKKDLVPYLGSLPKVSEVLARKRPLSLSMIRRLHRGLDIPADILLGEGAGEGVDLADEPGYDFNKFPWAEMIERRYFQGFQGTVRQAKERAEELIRSFMTPELSAQRQPAFLRSPLSQAGGRLLDDYAMLTWQIAVLKKARQQRSSMTKFKKGALTKEWLRDLVKLSRFDKGPCLVKEFLANIGITFVVEPHFKKTYLDGAAILDGDAPIVALTLRHDRLDNFWFALVHELVHVQRHLCAAHAFISDDLYNRAQQAGNEELEADEGALEALIPSEVWERSEVKNNPTTKNAIKLAEELRIHPSIVAGRVRKQTGNWRLLSNLIDGVQQHFQDDLYAH